LKSNSSQIQILSKLIKEKKLEEIVDYCDDILKNEPNNLLLLKIKAHATYEIGKIPAFNIVLNCIEKILEISPDDMESLILQIKTLRRLDRIDEAKISLEFAGEIEPDNPHFLIQKSSILLDQHRLNSAKKVLEHLTNIDIRRARINLGIVAQMEKRYDDALTYFSTYLLDHVGNFVATRHKIWLLFEMERYDYAILIAEEFVEKFGVRKFRMFRELAKLYFHIAEKFTNASNEEFDNQPCTFGSRILDESDEKWHDKKFLNTKKHSEYLREALRVYEKIDEMEIHNDESRYWKARTCISLENVKLGTEAIVDCLEEKESFDILSHQASFLKRQSKFKEAIEICDKILKDFPSDVHILGIKTDALFFSGDLLEYRRLFLKRHPVNDTEEKLTDELSIIPGKKIGNHLEVTKFLVNNIKGDLCILDSFFSSAWFSILGDVLQQTNKIDEIRIIASFQKILSFRDVHPLDKVDVFRSHIGRFGKLKGKSMKMMISKNFDNKKNETNIHDRFVISNGNIWNFISSDTLKKGDRADIFRIRNPKTIDDDLKRFEKLWNDEGNYEINGKKNNMFKKLNTDLSQVYEDRMEEERQKRIKDISKEDSTSGLSEMLHSEKD
jgi:tetratricopeptide (TPR) repeat protein